jgi:hypothetical protein
MEMTNSSKGTGNTDLATSDNNGSFYILLQIENFIPERLLMYSSVEEE